MFAYTVSLAPWFGHTRAAPDKTETYKRPLFFTPRIHMTDCLFLMSILRQPHSMGARPKTWVSEPSMHAGPDMVKRSPASSFPRKIKSDSPLLLMWPMGGVISTSCAGVPGVMTTADAKAAVAKTESLKMCMVAGSVGLRRVWIWVDELKLAEVVSSFLYLCRLWSRFRLYLHLVIPIAVILQTCNAHGRTPDIFATSCSVLEEDCQDLFFCRMVVP